MEHLESWEAREPELVAEIRKSLYVNDLLSGKPTVAEAKELKVGSYSDLRKWHSNVAELESEQSSVETKNTFA